LKNLYLLAFIVLCFLSCKDHIKNAKKEDNLYYDRAYDYLGKGVGDSAFRSFIKAKDLFLQRKDSMHAGICMVNMAIISNDNGDYFGSQEISLNAIGYFNQKKKDQFIYIRSNYNNLGIATQKLGDYKNALDFYKSAIKFAMDSLGKNVCLNNLATTYQDLRDYKSSINIYNRILSGASDNKKEYARALTNISYNKWLINPNYNALPDFLKALEIRIAEKDLIGQNASYLHLAEYHKNKFSDSSLIYAKKSYNVAKEVNSADDQLQALKTMIKLSPLTETKIYFDRYQNLSDSLQKARGAAKNQFALIRYQTEKHKADLLSARAENIQKKSDILRKNFILAILVLVLLLGYFWYRKRKKIDQQEKELEVKKTELKYVKKIHDKVANRVYHVMSEVDNNPNMNRGTLVDKLEVLYNISRDISYDFKESATQYDYAELLSEMLQSYSSAKTEILIVGNDDELWDDITEEAKTEFYTVMQELMTNMKRHSNATSVVIKLQRIDACISMLYSDNGVGLKNSIKSNGLTNTENRIKSIRGTVTFDSIPERGLEINITFPIY